jgi:membrane protease YdiL (CAAX protease family)
MLGLGLLLGAIVWIGMQLLSVLLAFVLGQLGIQVSGQQEVVNAALKTPPVIAILAVGLLAPIAEELFFRGITFNAWEREYGTRWAVIGSAVLFALVHIPGGTWIVIPIIFLLGLILALAYARTRSLGTTIGIHAMFNLTSLLLLLIAGS